MELREIHMNENMELEKLKIKSKMFEKLENEIEEL
jgi:hypothetical protein